MDRQVDDVLDIARAFLRIKLLARRRDWHACKAASVRILGIGYGQLQACYARTAGGSELRDALERQSRFLDDFLGRMAGSPSLEEQVLQTLSRSEAVDPDRFAERAKNGIATAANLCAGDFWGRDLADWAIMGMSTGLVGILHSELNLAYLRSREQGEILPDAAPIEAAADQFKNDLENGLHSIYRAAVANSTTRAADEARRLAAWVERSLPRLARLHAHAHTMLEELRAKGRMGDAEVRGRWASDASATLRDAVAAHAAAAKLAIELTSGAPDDTCSALMIRASRTPFAIDLPNGTDVEISHLPEVEDDKLIEVRGFITSVEPVRQPDGKLVSRIAVNDPSSQANCEAAAIFVNLSNLGVTAQGYCRFSGRFRQHSPLLGGRPGIEIDRLPLAQLIRDSWRVAFLRSARPWYRRWVNGTNIEWAIAPHLGPAPDGGDPLPSGANELVFLPLLRRS